MGRRYTAKLRREADPERSLYGYYLTNRRRFEEVLCARCGRELTDPKSRRAHHGPDCARIVIS